MRQKMGIADFTYSNGWLHSPNSITGRNGRDRCRSLHFEKNSDNKNIMQHSFRHCYFQSE
jgi:hypothetical protein